MFLEILFDDKFIANFRKWRFDFFYDFEENNSIVDDIPISNLVKWCDENPKIRYPFVASIVYLLAIENDEIIIKDIIYELIDKTSVLDDFLESLSNAIEPQAWSGSLADVIEKRLTLFTELQLHKNKTVQKWADKEHKKYLQIVKDTRTHEQERHENRFERFE